MPGRKRATSGGRAEERLAALLEVAKDVSGSLDLDATLHRVLPRVAALLPCDRVATYYWDPARQNFRDIGHYGVPPELEDAARGLEFSKDHPAVAPLTAGETLRLDASAPQSIIPPEWFAAFGIQHLVGVPLVVRGRMLGALVAVSTRAARRFDAAQLRLLESMGGQIGVAIETAELYRAQREEAEVAGALARVGHELIALSSTPLILDRLCQLTTEVLGTDCTYTLLWQPQHNAYAVVSGHGDRPEEWESIRLVKLPGPMLADGIRRLLGAGVANVSMSAFQHLTHGALAMQYGITRVLAVALRRGDEIKGLLAACERGREDPFSPQQERTITGVAQLAALALENARLVEELERASRLKSEFVATMSHELRTPLNVIVGYTDLLRDAVFGAVTPQQTDTLERIDKSAKQLLELINATLDVSRLESGRLPVELSEVSVEALMAEVDSETRELQNKPNVEFAWQVSPHLPSLRTDPLKLKVVLKNLINNAVKFTQRGGVTVRVAAAAGWVHFEVADTGIGIAPEAQEVIFEAFRQLDGSLTRQYGGVGLGLYIVRRLLEALGGSVSLDSAPGSGSRFRVSLPVDSGNAAA